MTIAKALREAARRLDATSDTARLDAELLMAHALGVTRSDLLLRHSRDEVPPEFLELVGRRERNEPVAYIIGRQEFYGLDLEVNPAVLIPRADSETLIEAARAAFAHRAPPRRILDLGTGSGALLLAALTLWPQAEGIGLDRDRDAVATARRNAERVGSSNAALPEGARFQQSDWNALGWQDGLGRFDLILANPPYVEESATLEPSVRDWEPAEALFAGTDGLDDYRQIIPHLPDLLEPEGLAVVEIGSKQARNVTRIAKNAHFRAQTVPDMGGRDRVLVLAFRGWQTDAK